MKYPMRAALFAFAFGLLLTAAAYAQPESVPAERVTVEVVASKTSVKPGDQLALAVVFRHQAGWHVHTNAPVVPPELADLVPIPTEINPASPPPGVTFGAVQWPKPVTVMVDLLGTGKPVPYGVFEGTAIAYLPVQIDPAAKPGVITIPLAVAYQACDDTTCLLPVTLEQTVTLTVESSPPPQSAPDPAIFGGFDPTSFGQIAPRVRKTKAELGFFGFSFSIDTAGTLGLVGLLLVAMLGGFLLNLTPCVLPLIPIKILGLSQAAANRRRFVLLGLVMSAGVVFFWMSLGLAVVSIAGFDAVNTLFQYTAFKIGVGLVIAFMAVGMLGVFTARLPGWVYAVNPRHDTVHGSLLFGVMTAVLSTPCTAPFMGGAIAWATQQPVVLTLATFAAIGLGMALPYALLTAFPSLVDSIPRAGPASELIKQVMGLFMLAVAVFFLGTGLDPLLREHVDPPVRGYWWAVAALVVLACVWLVIRGLRFFKIGAVGRGVLMIFALALSVGAVLFARQQTDRGPIAWIAYTPQRYEELRAAGSVLVIDCTAEWCLNCKALEATVLHDQRVVDLLRSPGVVPMKIDITGGYPDGLAFMKKLGWTSIPLLVIEGPGLDKPLTYDTYTAATLLEAVGRARR